MKAWTLLILFLIPLFAEARVLSPTSLEVRFTYRAEFQTSKPGPAEKLALEQAKFLFGYMQNPQIGPSFGIDPRIGGIGAPRWEPQVRVLEDRPVAGPRLIRYEMSGLLLLHKTAARKLLARGKWEITLPYDLDHFFLAGCHDPGYPAPDEFWYFYFPFQTGCERLRAMPLARPVTVDISPAPAVPEDLETNLAALRGDNGNGDVFQIAAINGFDESSRKGNDDGRLNFMKMNAWLREQGFKMTILQHFKDRPLYLFEKTLIRADGSPVQARILRLLADTDLDSSKKVTFAKFLKRALEESDVVIYEGHSGLGVNLDLEQIERQLLHSRDPNLSERVEFNRTKHQLFFFDSCSSYSYYLGMFDGKKDPGTLAVMSNGLESAFGFELPTTKHLYRMLLDLDHKRIANDHLTWMELLETFERPLRGASFLLNVDVND